MSGNDPFSSVDLDSELQFPPPPIIHYEGWRHYVQSPRAQRPDLPTPDEFTRMPTKVRAAFATARKRYHAKFGPIETPALAAVHAETLRLAALNYNAPPGARQGVILDGWGTTGKSTIATELGRKYELSLRKKMGTIAEDFERSGRLFIPVIYVTLPGNVTIKNFNRLLTSFLGFPTPSTADEAWLTDRIVDNARQCGTSLVIVDDIHFLKMRNRSAQDINNHFKYLASSISATFIYAGIEVESTGLLTEGSSKDNARFSQTQHRFKKYKITAFTKGSDEFKRLLNSFENHLLLMRLEPGTLARLADYIHDRTNGFIGAVSGLLREGANLAITSSEERLTEALLERVRLDHASEEHRNIVRPKRRQPKSAAPDARAAKA